MPRSQQRGRGYLDSSCIGNPDWEVYVRIDLPKSIPYKGDNKILCTPNSMTWMDCLNKIGIKDIDESKWQVEALKKPTGSVKRDLNTLVMEVLLHYAVKLGKDVPHYVKLVPYDRNAKEMNPNAELNKGARKAENNGAKSAPQMGQQGRFHSPYPIRQSRRLAPVTEEAPSVVKNTAQSSASSAVGNIPKSSAPLPLRKSILKQIAQESAASSENSNAMLEANGRNNEPSIPNASNRRSPQPNCVHLPRQSQSPPEINIVGAAVRRAEVPTTWAEPILVENNESLARSSKAATPDSENETDFFYQLLGMKPQSQLFQCAPENQHYNIQQGYYLGTQPPGNVLKTVGNQISPLSLHHSMLQQFHWSNPYYSVEPCQDVVQYRFQQTNSHANEGGLRYYAPQNVHFPYIVQDAFNGELHLHGGNGYYYCPQ